MKKVIWPILTLVAILFVNGGLAILFDHHFLDWSFLTGLGATIIIAFFHSSGGFTSDLIDAKFQSNENDFLQMEAWTKIDRQKREFHSTPSLYVAICYTIIAGIITFIHYKDFFLN